MLLGAVITGGCGAPVNIPLDQEHPAYSFYQTANAFHVSSRSCTKLKGSLEIRPDKIGEGREYTKIKELAPGLLLTARGIDGKQFITVLFMEYGMAASIPKACSWNTNDFPLRNSTEKKE